MIKKAVILSLAVSSLFLRAAPDTIDATFAATAGQVFDAGAYGGISSIYVQPDGKILFGSNEMPGDVGGPRQMSLIRVNPDGTIDSHFSSDSDPNGAGTGIQYIGTGWPEVHALGMQSDQKIIAAGVMTGMNDGTTSFLSSSIVRINPDGTVDNTLQTGGTVPWPFGGFNYIEEVTVQPDDKIICVGGFGGIYAPGKTSSETRFGIARLNADGSLDTSFHIDPLEFGVPGDAFLTRGFFRQAAVDASGKIYVVGSLEWGNTFPAPSVPIFARLFPNGEKDPSFNPPTPVDLEAWAGVAIQDDGRILAFGGTGSVSAPSHLARYHPDGSLDGSFSLSPSAGIINTRPLRIAPDGKIILSQSNGTSYASLIRLNSNGSLDSSFNPTSAWVSDAGKQPTLINFITAPTGKIYSGSFFDQVQGISTKKIVAFEGNTIADTISWASLDPEIVESAGTLYLALRRTGSAATPGSITVTTSTGSAGVSDFTSLAATASWGATSGIIYVPISLTDDSDIEGDETFTVTLSAASGASLSGPASITVTLIDDETAPVILTHPVSISVKEGESATFSVAVDSPIPPTYQWYKNGGIIAGATSSSYTIPTSSPADAASYTVTVAIPGFSVNSNPATLTVIPPAAVVDATYVPDSGLEPFTLTILPDGSIIIYEGNFSAGYTLRKLDPSGVLDPTFSPTIVPLSGFTNINPTLFPLPSGQILITGFFESINGVNRPQVALLNADGSIDPTFDVGLPNNTAIAYSSGAAVTASGEIYLHYRENGTAGAIHRRLLDGSIDPTFTTTIGSGLNGRLRSLIELPDGSLLISHLSGGGSFTQGITRLRSNGDGFTGFNPVNFLSTGTPLVYLPGEKFAVGSGATLRVYDLLGNPLETVTFTGNLTGLSYHQGRFIVTGPTSYDGVEIPGLARLSLDGSLDDNFPGGSGPNGSVTQIRFDPTGRMIAVGSFTNWNGIPRERIARLLIEAPEAGFFLPSSLAFEDESPHQIQLVRYGDDSEELTVNVVSSDDTATSPADYTAIDQSFTWPAGDSTPITLDLSLIDNADTDGDRNLTLTMTSGPGSDTIVTNTHAVTIRDDESLPSIDSQPEDVFGLDGSPASFAVSVSSPSPLIYQWYFNGALIPGANSDTYAIASVAPGNEGLYSVLVTNDYDSIFSDSVSLTIVEPPLNVADGYTPTLTFSSTIRAVATAPDGGAYVGGDFINLNSDLTRDYFAKVNADGTLDTAFSPVIDNRVMDIVVQEDGKIIVGGNFNNVEGSQSRDLARFNPDGTADTAFNANIGSGSNNRVEGVDILPDGKIIVTGVFSSWAGSSLSPQRDLIRLNQDGTLDIAYDQRTSSPSIYDVKALPTGEVLVAFNTSSFAATKVARFTADGLQDSSFDYSSGKPMVRRIALASDGDYLFTGAETFKINPDGSTDTSFGAITGNDLRQQINGKIVTTQRNIVRYLTDGTIDPIFPSSAFNSNSERLDLRDDGKIWIVGGFTNYTGTNPATSASRIILINGDPIPVAITQQPLSVTQDPGTTATFSIKATGTSTITYQWKKNGAPLSDDASTSGSNTNTLTIQTIDDADAGDYTCTITNLSGSETSNVVNLIVLGIPEFVTHPENLSIPAGYPANFTAEAIGAGSLTYQWYRNGSPLSDDETITGSTTNSLKISPASEANSGDYVLKAINGLGTMNSNVATLTVNFNPAAIAEGYTAPSLFYGDFYAIVPLDDGAALVGGSFGNATYSHIMVVESNGEIRDLPLKANSAVRVIRRDSNGKYLVAGDFTEINETPRSRIARLNADFSLDQTFDPGVGPTQLVYDFHEDENGALFATGFFQNWNGDTNHKYLVKLNDDGTLDTSFTSVLSSITYQGIPLPGGDLLTAGSTSNPDGDGSTTSDNYVFRINSDGTYDPGFLGDVGFFPPTKLFLDSSNRVYANSGIATLHRFDINGNPDPGFDTSLLNGQTSVISQDASGRLLLGGYFTEAYGADHPRLVRLNTDDSVDTSFGVGTGPNNGVSAIAEAADTSIWIGGSFTEYNGIPMSYLIRLQGDSATGNTDPFEDFLDAAGVPEGQRGPNDDPDQDGRDNLVEFLQSTNPTVRDGAGYRLHNGMTTGGGGWINSLDPSVNLDPAKRYRVIYYNIPKDTKGLNLQIQASRNLSAMDDGSAQAIEFGTPVDHGIYETRSFYILPSATEEPRMFWRLYISQPQ